MPVNRVWSRIFFLSWVVALSASWPARAFDVGVYRHVKAGDKLVIEVRTGKVKIKAAAIKAGELKLTEITGARGTITVARGTALVSGARHRVMAARCRNYEEAAWLAEKLLADTGLNAVPAFPESGWQLWVMNRLPMPLGSFEAALPPMSSILVFDSNSAQSTVSMLKQKGYSQAQSVAAPGFDSAMKVEASGAAEKLDQVLMLDAEPTGKETISLKFTAAGAGTVSMTLRGSVRVRMDAYGGFTVINRLGLEEYLYGVLPHEVGGNAPIEAQKAQAVVARTYSLKNSSRFAVDGYHLCGDTNCQVYGGQGSETEASRMAVDKTVGLALVYQDELADALYFSTAGGHTAAFDEAFDGSPRAYLPGVFETASKPKLDLTREDDFARFITQTSGFYDQDSKYFRWEQSFTPAQAARLLKDNLKNIGIEFKSFAKVTDIKVLNRGTSGRIIKLEIVTDTGSIFVGRDKIRWAFGGLKSSMFKVQKSKDGFKFTGGGWGHGIGLCQVGAKALARQGKKYTDILSHYFPGAKIAGAKSHPAYSAGGASTPAVVAIEPGNPSNPTPAAGQGADSANPGQGSEPVGAGKDDSDPVAILIQGLELEGDKNSAIRAQSARALGEAGAKRGIEALGKVMNADMSWEVKLAAAASLVQLGEKGTGLPVLASGLGHDWWQVRLWTSNELGRIRDLAYDLVLKALKDGDERVRIAAMNSLSLAPKPLPEAAEIVAGIIPGAQGLELETAVRILGRIGTRAQTGPLQGLLKNASDPMERILIARSMAEIQNQTP